MATIPGKDQQIELYELLGFKEMDLPLRTTIVTACNAE